MGRFPLSVRLTVETDTPACSATSRIVTINLEYHLSPVYCDRLLILRESRFGALSKSNATLLPISTSFPSYSMKPSGTKNRHFFLKTEELCLSSTLSVCVILRIITIFFFHCVFHLPSPEAPENKNRSLHHPRYGCKQ